MRCPSFSIVMAVDRGWWSNPNVQLGWGCLWLQAALCCSSCNCLRRSSRVLERSVANISFTNSVLSHLLSNSLYYLDHRHSFCALMTAVIVVITWSFSVLQVLYGCFNWCGCACSFVSGWHWDCCCPCPQRRYPRQCLQFLTALQFVWGCPETAAVVNELCCKAQQLPPCAALGVWPEGVSWWRLQDVWVVCVHGGHAVVSGTLAPQFRSGCCSEGSCPWEGEGVLSCSPSSVSIFHCLLSDVPLLSMIVLRLHVCWWPWFFLVLLLVLGAVSWHFLCLSCFLCFLPMFHCFYVCCYCGYHAIVFSVSSAVTKACR